MATLRFRRAFILAFLDACWISVVRAATPTVDDTVLLVCEHGSVKSLMAATLFRPAGSQRGMSIRAVARGIAPDAQVPKRIVEGLKADGVDVSELKPTRMEQTMRRRRSA